MSFFSLVFVSRRLLHEYRVILHNFFFKHEICWFYNLIYHGQFSPHYRGKGYITFEGNETYFYLLLCHRIFSYCIASLTITASYFVGYKWPCLILGDAIRYRDQVSDQDIFISWRGITDDIGNFTDISKVVVSVNKDNFLLTE